MHVVLQQESKSGRTCFSDIITRLRNPGYKCGEICVYKFIASHLHRPMWRNYHAKFTKLITKIVKRNYHADPLKIGMPAEYELLEYGTYDTWFWLKLLQYGQIKAYNVTLNQFITDPQLATRRGDPRADRGPGVEMGQQIPTTATVSDSKVSYRFAEKTTRSRKVSFTKKAMLLSCRI